MMYTDPALISAVEQSVDALCFYSTHTVDTDFRSHAKTAIDTIHSLQAEQKQRIDATYGGALLSPDQVADQLEELYHADAQSIPSSNSQGGGAGGAAPATTGSVVDAMSPVTARIFKREMKVRIHEWEASFRHMYGRDATPVDKAGLRGIYELYKTVKIRVQQDDEARKNGGTPSVANSTATLTSTTPAGYGAAAVRPHRPSTTGSSNVTATSPSPAVEQPMPQPPPHPRPSDSPKPAHRDDFAAGPVMVDPAAPPAPQPAAVPQQPPVQPMVSVAPTPPPPTSANPTTPVAPPPSGQPLDMVALVAEKKSLKRKLHQFEDDFKKQHGRVPTKEDRRLVGRDYHRYGELKALLAQSS